VQGGKAGRGVGALCNDGVVAAFPASDQLQLSSIDLAKAHGHDRDGVIAVGKLLQPRRLDKELARPSSRTHASFVVACLATFTRSILGLAVSQNNDDVEAVPVAKEVGVRCQRGQASAHQGCLMRQSHQSTTECDPNPT
jgi:hypothetical protein